MSPRKNYKERHVSTGVSLPAEKWDRLDDLLLKEGKGRNRSEFIGGLVDSVLEEDDKQTQLEKQMEPANKDVYRSPIGQAMEDVEQFNNDVCENETSDAGDYTVVRAKVDSRKSEKQYLSQFDELIAKDMGNANNLAIYKGWMTERIRIINSHLENVNGESRKSRIMSEIEEAMQKDQERRRALDKTDK